ncbi:MAG: hypothetical protein JXB88_20585 [Spirochaetales bacterium]|nr:hypothetical protein [Spirochaetales bacterium]
MKIFSIYKIKVRKQYLLLTFLVLSAFIFLTTCSFIDLTGLDGFEKKITSFVFKSSENNGLIGNITGVIKSDIINATVPYGTDLDLTPSITIIGKSVSPGNEVQQTFVDGVGVPYAVKAEDDSTKTYLVTVTVASKEAKDITAFGFLQTQNPSLSTDIMGVISDNTITIDVPMGTDTSGLVPTISFTGESIDPPNNTANSFPDGTGVTYTITAGDGSTCVYTVTVYKPPAPGNSGTLSFSGITEDSITVNWTKGDDDQTPQENLEYLVYYSINKNLNTVSSIEANGTPVGAYTQDINTLPVSGLSPDILYYFNIIVKDQNDYKTAYTMNSQNTIDETPPVQGGAGAITTISGPTLIILIWTKATDNATQQNKLQYLVYYSLADNIDTVANIEANGTPVGTYMNNISTKTVNGLSNSTTYYFNVIVKDQSNNKTAYIMISQTTLDGT